MSEETAAYRENYKTMEQTLREIESMDVPDVDAVIPLMEKFNSAFLKSIARIDQVENLRNEMMAKKTQE
jgi:hypothetical protein